MQSKDGSSSEFSSIDFPVVGPVMCGWNAILAESLSSQIQYKDLGIILQDLLVENLESPTSLNIISLISGNLVVGIIPLQRCPIP